MDLDTTVEGFALTMIHRGFRHHGVQVDDLEFWVGQDKDICQDQMTIPGIRMHISRGSYPPMLVHNVEYLQATESYSDTVEYATHAALQWEFEVSLIAYQGCGIIQLQCPSPRDFLFLFMFCLEVLKWH